MILRKPLGPQPRALGIENSLHYVRDVTFAEDHSRLRTGQAPQFLAACRNLAITLIHRSGSSHIAASRRPFSYHPHAAFDLLLSRASLSNISQPLRPLFHSK